MRQLVEFPLHGGGTVLVQVEQDGPPSGVVTRGRADQRVVEQAQDSFDTAVGRIQPAVGALLTRMRTLRDAPEEIEVEFGIGFSAEAGAFLAAAGASANFLIRMRWRPGSDRTDQQPQEE